MNGFRNCKWSKFWFYMNQKMLVFLISDLILNFHKIPIQVVQWLWIYCCVDITFVDNSHFHANLFNYDIPIHRFMPLCVCPLLYIPMWDTKNQSNGFRRGFNGLVQHEKPPKTLFDFNNKVSFGDFQIDGLCAICYECPIFCSVVYICSFHWTFAQ